MNKINRVFDLKSSLDRFIEKRAKVPFTEDYDLKSSLDRFIVDEMNADDEEEIFKIQFG